MKSTLNPIRTLIFLFLLTDIALAAEVSLSGSSVAIAGDPIIVQFSEAPGESEFEWVGVFDPVDNHLFTWEYTGGLVDGMVVLPLSLSKADSYELRLYPANSYDSVARTAFEVDRQLGTVVKTVEPIYSVGVSIDFQLYESPGNQRDWIGIYDSPESGDRNYLAWMYTAGITDGSVSFAGHRLPKKAGQYQARLFVNNSFQKTAETDFEIIREPKYRIDVIDSRVPFGEPVMIGLSNVPNTSRDWVGIYSSNESNNRSFLTWSYTSESILDTLTFTGLSEGAYEARYFVKNTFTQVAEESFEITPQLIKKTTVALLGDIAWIEPQVFEELSSSLWPTTSIDGVRIRSRKEILSASSVLTGEELSVYQVGEIYEVAVPSFNFVDFVSLTYRPDNEVEPMHSLPHWSMDNLLNGYTALSAGYYFKPQLYGDAYTHAEAKFRSLGFSKYTRMAKGSTDFFTTMWDSNSIVGSDGLSRLREIEDSVSGMTERAQYHDLDLIAYYKDMGDAEARRLHPEWECRTPEGELTHDKFVMMDFATAWNDVVSDQLLELASKGVKGVYFDFVHSPQWGCYGTEMQNMFEQATGLDAPTLTPEGHHWSNHPNWNRYMQFQAAILAQAFADWKTTVKSQFPEFVFIVSSTYVSGLTSAIHANSIAEVADLVKVEFDHGNKTGLRHRVFEKNQDLAKPSDHVLMMLAHLVPRDYSSGQKFHSWASGFANEDQLKGFIASTLAMGGVPDIFVAEQYLRSDFNPENYVPVHAAQTPYEALPNAIQFGKTIEREMQHKSPMSYVGVYFDETIKNSYGTDYEQAWRDIIWPSVGAYDNFLRLGVPVMAVNRDTLAKHLDNFSVLYLPFDRAMLSPSVLALVNDFEGEGGVVLQRDESIDWGSIEDNPDANAEFAAQIQPLKTQAPFWVDAVDSESAPVVYPFFYH